MITSLCHTPTTCTVTPTGAWIAGNACALYVSYAGQDLSLGPLQRSTDEGVSWNSVGFDHTSGSTPNMNEIDDMDWQNMSIVGYGAIVYAVGTNATGVWETTDGGDGALSEAALAPQITFERAPFFSGNDTLFSYLCSPSTIYISYQNLQCAITKLSSFSVTGLAATDYTATTTNHNDCLSLPDSIALSLYPTSPGIRTVTITAHFTDDEFKTKDTSLRFVLEVHPGSTIPIRVFFQPATITAKAGDTVSIPVYLSGQTALGATSIDLPFQLDSNALEPIGFEPHIPGLMLDSSSLENDTDAVHLHADDLAINGNTLLGTLRCIAYVSDSLSTSISLASMGLSASKAGCISLSLTTDTVHVQIAGCGVPTLSGFMRTGKVPIAIRSILPDPAGEQVRIVFDNPLQRAVTYQVVDALGTLRAEGETAAAALTLDVSALPGGMYFVRATDRISGTSAVAKFFVQR